VAILTALGKKSVTTRKTSKELIQSRQLKSAENCTQLKNQNPNTHQNKRKKDCHQPNTKHIIRVHVAIKIDVTHRATINADSARVLQLLAWREFSVRP